MSEIVFRVIDNNTGKEADPYLIALHEEWAKDLMYCDMDQFYIGEDGELILADECGGFKYCDRERFKVVHEKEPRPSVSPNSKPPTPTCEPKTEICTMVANLLKISADLPDTMENDGLNWMQLRDIRKYLDLCVEAVEKLKESQQNAGKCRNN